MARKIAKPKKAKRARNGKAITRTPMFRKLLEKELRLRAYDIAKTFINSDWTSASKNNANEETKAAIAPGREKARALVQNAPYGTRAVDVIVAETVGTGIVAKITGRNKSQTKKLNELWKAWAETTACDYEGQDNFYGLQELLLRSTIESGEGLALKKFDENGPKIQIIESDFIDTTKDQENNIQGIQLDVSGKRINYHLFKEHPGGRNPTLETKLVPASEVLHVYRKRRPGQLRGITWAHAVIEKMKDFDDYQNATLIRQKIAACFGGFITTSGNDSLVDASDLKAKREAELAMEPNTWRYLNPGEDVKIASPPGVDGYDGFNRETLRAVAAGWGISYETLTGDYSQSNYSSSRMGHLQMRKNIETWRWNMLIPQFCDPFFKMFLFWAKVNGFVTDKDIKNNSVKIKWVPPAYSMIDPSKEIEATKREVRAGFKSWSEAVQEQGRDPDEVLNEISEDNKQFDARKIVLDTDPRKMSQIGFVQSTDPLALDSKDSGDTNSEEQQIEEDVTNQPDPSGDK